MKIVSVFSGRLLSRIVLPGAVFAVVAIFWLLLAPTSIGGPVTYVVTSGTSMEPTIKDGALILVRTPDEYRVGDIAAFNSPGGNLVLHRIIGHDGDRFVMRGDNNAAPDRFQPTEADMAGELWLHIPAVGNVLTGPLWFWIIAGGVILAAVAIVARHAGDSLSGRNLFPRPAGTSRTVIRPVAAVGLVALLVTSGLTLALLSFSLPLQTERVTTFTYVHHGELQYRADADPVLYSGGVANSGDPVYRRHADEVELTFAYSLVSDEPVERVTGSAAIQVVIQAPDGWRSTIDIEPATTFEGRDLQIRSALDLGDVDRRIAELEETAGLPPDYHDQYQLSLVATVTLQGNVGAVEVPGDFVGQYQFLLDDYVFRVDTSQEPFENGELVVQAPGATSARELVDNHLDFGAFTLDVNTARSVGMAAAISGIAAATVLAGGLLLQRHHYRQTAYATMSNALAPVDTRSGIPYSPGRQAVRLVPIRPRSSSRTEVRDAQPDLARLADSLGQVSTRLDEHSRSVDVRFDEVLDGIDSLTAGLQYEAGRVNPPVGRQPVLRPIRLRARTNRREASPPDDAERPDGTSRAGE